MKSIVENSGVPIKIGDQRIRVKFLWTPKTLPIKGKTAKITRWLEMVQILQEFGVKRKYEQHNPYYSKTEEYRDWNDIEWDDIDIIIKS